MPAARVVDPAATVTLPRAWGVGWRDVAQRRHAIAWLIAGFTALRLVLAACLPLLPEEAYYWSWSRHLDWSYFDHPPLATYSIALTTAVFGQTALGIKLAAVLWALGWNLLWARLILDLYDDRRLAFWSLAALNLTVLYEIFGVGPSPDAPLLLAWTGAVWSTWRLSHSGDGRWWLAIGAFVGLSWLAKYTGLLLLPVIGLYLLGSRANRAWLRRPHPWLAAALALALFAPVLYWNARHDWASFAFQGSRRVGALGGFTPHYVALLAATQFLLLTPYVFVIAFGALGRGARDALARRLDDRARLLLLSAAVPIGLFTLVSLRSLVKLNWLAPAWWSLVVLGVRHALGLPDAVPRLVRGLAPSAALLLAAGVVAAIPNLPIPGELDTWSGWGDVARHAEQAAAAARAQGHETFFFSPSYRTSSMLRFYLPGQPRTYAQDVYGDPALEFDYLPLPSELKGDTGILVLTPQDQRSLDRQRLARLFNSVELVDVVEVTAFGRTTRRAEIYRCTDYRGHPRQSAAPGRAPAAS